MSGPLSVADVLSRAADLLALEGAWTQGQYAATAEGRMIGPTETPATCWCILGAIQKAGAYAHDKNPAALSMGAFIFAPERTQAEVVATLRQAANLARERAVLASVGSEL